VTGILITNLNAMNSKEKENMETISKVTIMKYRHFHVWMLIPFLISILGFSYSYYLNLANATFHQHVHAISATLWYILVIVQPYLIIRKQSIQRHRTLGTIGIILAGMVAGSAFAIIPKNIDNVNTLDVNGFFNPTIAYFVTLLDFVLICMFVLSVSLAILNIKKRNLSGHVQWLMASVFFVLSPALSRMLGIVAIFLNNGNIEGITMVKMAIPTMIVMLALIVFFYYKFGSFKHLSFKLLLICQLLSLFVKQIGDNEFIRNLLTAIFKV
jgi:tellurite resistance protein TehA-like permease